MTPPRPPGRRTRRGHGRPARRPPRPPPGAPRPGSRAPPPCCAGSTPWSSTAPAGTPLSPPAPPSARRRQPDQRFPRTRHGAPRPSSPMRGRASPYRRRGPTPCDTLGSSPPVARSFSPARLNAVGAGQPASPRAGRARLHYVEREDPGHRHAGNRPAEHPSSPVRRFPMPSARPRYPSTPASQATPAPAVARTPSSAASLPNHLTDSLLRWCRGFVLVIGDDGGQRGDPQVGGGFAGRVLVPAAERGFDFACADAGAARAVQAGQDGAADVAGQVRGGGEDAAGAGDRELGGFDGDLVAGPVGVGARHGGDGVGDRDPQCLVDG